MKEIQCDRFRLSSYTIFVSIDKTKGEYLLVHGYTGAIDYIDSTIASVLRSGQYVSLAMFYAAEVHAAEETFNRLVSRGYLTARAPKEEKKWVSKFANYLHGNESVKSNFLFLVAYDCNFRCPYCFENEISDTGKGWSKKVLTKELVDAAYASMKAIDADPKNYVKEIILYGGEPLLKENLEIVEYIIAKGKPLGFHFKAITNGYDLDSFLHLLGPGKLEKLQITIDGVKEKHDGRRTHYLHGSSFDKIINNVQVALDLGTKVTIRINTELNNFDEISKLYECFKSLKFTSYANFRVYSALIHGDEEMNCNAVMAPEITEGAVAEEAENEELPFEYNPDAQYIDFEGEAKFFEEKENDSWTAATAMDFEDDHIRTMNRGKFVEKFNELTKEKPEIKAAISCQDFGIRRKLKAAIKGDTKMAFTSVFCSAQTGMIIFDPYGDIHTCWETVGQDAFKVGTYGKDGLQLDEEKLGLWYNKNISKVPACSKCKYALFCGGGCMAHAIMEGRGFNSPYCDGFPATFHKVAADLYEDLTEKA